MELQTTENRILMERARNALQGKWGLAIGAALLFVLITVVAQEIPKIGGLISFIIGGPLSIGLYIFSLSISRNQTAKIEQLFEGFQIFLNAVITYFLLAVFVILWMLLLIVPGIIAAYSYAMTFLIIADNPTLKPLEAISKSKEMMRGYKWKLFCLHFRFIGWFLLCLLTLGIGFFWFIPYISVSTAKFYDDIKDNTEIKTIEAV